VRVRACAGKIPPLTASHMTPVSSFTKCSCLFAKCLFPPLPNAFASLPSAFASLPNECFCQMPLPNAKCQIPLPNASAKSLPNANAKCLCQMPLPHTSLHSTAGLDRTPSPLTPSPQTPSTSHPAVIDQEASILQAPEHIQKQCELIASKAGAKFQFHAQPKMEEGVIATIARTAERTRADLLLVGAYGLKIEAGAEPKDSFSVMGSVSDGAYPRHVRASMSHTWSMSGLPLAARAPPTSTYNRRVRVRRMTRGYVSHAFCYVSA